MKASELRIGNTVYSTIEETWILPYVIAIDISHCEVHPENYSPIPLTEEWLLKFGFNQYGDWYTKDSISVNIKINRTTYDIDGEEDYINHCAHVHQIQNLYFALTGEELTINS